MNIQLDKCSKLIPPIGNSAAGKSAKDIQHDTFKNAEARAAFSSSWMYCMHYVSFCYYEGLLDHKSILKWLVEKVGMKASAFSQMNLLIPLVWNLLDELTKSRQLTRVALDAFISRAKLVCSS
ncbi:hypothetical protein HDU84_006896 [Entophlyctis sp. JEL0112]|nr:hypothetical protein HDU84_006896 [Entophlyctis sp. JEL0112]